MRFECWEVPLPAVRGSAVAPPESNACQADQKPEDNKSRFHAPPPRINMPGLKAPSIPFREARYNIGGLARSQGLPLAEHEEFHSTVISPDICQ
jgi:hypothetical protein